MKVEELPGIGFVGWLRDNMPSDYNQLVTMACAVAQAEIKSVRKTDKAPGQTEVFKARTVLISFLQDLKVRSKSKGVTLRGPLSVYEIVNFAG